MTASTPHARPRVIGPPQVEGLVPAADPHVFELRFYQRRGFRLAALHRRAADDSLRSRCRAPADPDPR
jgi:hypothetical protein